MDLSFLINLSQEAGTAIMRIYNSEFGVEYKTDQSPLTEADRVSHQVIEAGLKSIWPQLPVLSEEGAAIPFSERCQWNSFWLVDPLDGTKEFLNRNGEFTVNIALIHDLFPVLGIVHVPVTGYTYVGNHEGAFLVDVNGNRRSIYAHQPEKELLIIESRSHPSPEADAIYDRVSSRYNTIDRIKKGSSLKLCAIASGEAHLYPRLGPTMEWDTAAGQAIVEAAGGVVVELTGRRLSYNKECLRNAPFIVAGHSEISELLCENVSG